MPINLTALRNELLPGLYAVNGRYTKIPNRWSQCGFARKKSKLTVERSTQMQYLRTAVEKSEGGSTQFDDGAGEAYVYSAETREIGLGYIMTRKAIDDNLYKTQFGPSNLGLQDSFAQTKDIYAADIFNAGTTLIPGIGGDGKALFATDHPLKGGGTIANKPAVEVDLNEASLLASMKAIRANWKDEAGLKITARAKKLAIPVNLEDVAIRLLKTDKRPGTANNDVNAIRAMGGGFSDYVVNEFFTSDFAWFVLTDKPGLIYWEKVPFEMDMVTDFDTDNLKVKGYERYCFSYDDWRAAYGSFPTA